MKKFHLSISHNGLKHEMLISEYQISHDCTVYEIFTFMRTPSSVMSDLGIVIVEVKLRSSSTAASSAGVLLEVPG